MEPNMYTLSLENKSGGDLYALCRWDTYDRKEYVKEKMLDKDSSLYISVKVEPGYYHAFWEEYEEPQYLFKPTDTINVFILDKEEYEGKTWSQLVDSAHFRQIYHLSGDDIRLIGKRIPYPPNEKMCNMDMVPSYDEIER
ncbi:MAG: hypothetical protein MJZ33_02975 [Paludibacteraceae bacterium]|nr:hypothetical protein [Paludibacteraceae bacterium]